MGTGVRLKSQFIILVLVMENFNLPTEFSFESKEEYKTFAGRRRKKLKEVLNYSLLIIGIWVVIGLFLHPEQNIKDKLSILMILLGILVFIRVIYSALVCYWIRNYIVKLTFENGVITVDYAHYDIITRYTGTLADVQIEKNINFFSMKGPTVYFEHYLQLNFVKDKLVIKQGKTLDWNDAIIDGLIQVAENYIAQKTISNVS